MKRKIIEWCLCVLIVASVLGGMFLLASLFPDDDLSFMVDGHQYKIINNTTIHDPDCECYD